MRRVVVSFLATADVHLKQSESDARIDVLRWLCDTATRQGVDALLIAGDLFDSSNDARSLAGDVKGLFEDALSDSIPVIMVAGNHDETLGDLGWPESVRVLERGESTRIDSEAESLRVHGLPYNRGGSFESLESVFDLDAEETNVLLSHASFFSPKHRHLLARIEKSDEDNKYLLHAEDFRGSNFDQVLLGHWHGYQPLIDDPPVHYVGSPVPNSRNETGEKGFLLGEVESGDLTLSREGLETPPGWYYENQQHLVVPGYEDDLLDRLRDDVTLAPGCRLRLSLTGYTNRDTETFRRDVEALFETDRPEGSTVTLDLELQDAEELDAPLIDRMFESIDEASPSEVLSIDELVSSAEPDRVVSTMRRLLEEEPESIKRRARQMFLESIVGVLES